MIESCWGCIEQGSQGYKVKSSFRKRYRHHNKLINLYGICVSLVITDMFLLYVNFNSILVFCVARVVQFLFFCVIFCELDYLFVFLFFYNGVASFSWTCEFWMSSEYFPLHFSNSFKDLRYFWLISKQLLEHTCK